MMSVQASILTAKSPAAKRARIASLCAVALAGCASSPHALPPASVPRTAIAPAQAAPEPRNAAQPSSISAIALGLYRAPEAANAPPSADELQVIESAKLLLGQPPGAKVSVNGRKFVLDCIGTVSAIFWRMNIDVQKDFPLYSGNGVSRLYRSLENRGALHQDRFPRPGDIIFWDNTWDANGDGDRTNDPRTHAGIVLAVDEDGTIQYVHENLSKGVMIEVMNLLNPALASDASGKRINNTMAIATISGGSRPERYFSGDVFDRFGDLLGNKSHYLAATGPLDSEYYALAPSFCVAPIDIAMADR